ncbi:hypothetical protein C3941_19595 [Kaistia algarum]|uniref:hypothetical protein n=1 Tax=Kaistia algarum TaxID=2083279 RepID=UPI000CE7237F|nr:hypothetical protein [Kaistia algarum]MCX5516197.1 hypothetical protein [Kaistia algarum]PPE78271.1 hypothetical protein C3941_19595 [Kaistia algarum]
MSALPRSLLSLPQADLERALIARASRAIRIEVKAGARLMVDQPWRIERALRPDLYGPVPASIAGRLQRAEARIDLERQLARSPQAYLASPGRMVALREARLALRYLRRFVHVEVVPIHEAEMPASDWRMAI